ncbi:MAG: glutamate formimidoyltransferase [Prevotellaceae bacterium]|jgi:glutamate formiminotransferase/formiminotetrahydrofolate cyclodeaminase|nr:glutamate formimidoyltransferase [Prevotellaceae bacterium]
MKIIACVPNFSEGCDVNLIRQIAGAVEAVEGVHLLGVESGRAANRTVVTFAGEPEAVCEAAFRAAEKATALIDMRKHHGIHPRFGATDVLPLIPVAGVTMDEAVALARALAQRIGNELQFPVYCYEQAAFCDGRRNLAHCRAGGYEGLAAKLAAPEWQPDFGPARFVPRTGATAVGARNVLVAYNVNLDTASVALAHAVALDVRESGGGLRLKAVKAIGWFVEEYRLAQVSMNLTDIAATPLHAAFEAVCGRAQARGVRVTGSEVVGLVPLQAMLEAGRYFLAKLRQPVAASDSETIQAAVRNMGLDEVKPFDPQQKIMEYKMQLCENRRRRRYSSSS